MIIPLHTTPETSVKEIDELVDVYMDVKHRWKAEVMTAVSAEFPSSRGRLWSLSGMSTSPGRGRGQGMCWLPPLTAFFKAFLQP